MNCIITAKTLNFAGRDKLQRLSGLRTVRFVAREVYEDYALVVRVLQSVSMSRELERESGRGVEMAGRGGLGDKRAQHANIRGIENIGKLTTDSN